jgi:hypothetical protein
MRAMRYVLICAVGIALLGGGLGVGRMWASAGQHAPATAVKAKCMEDDPCWDCKTMGNRVCAKEWPAEPACDVHCLARKWDKAHGKEKTGVKGKVRRAMSYDAASAVCEGMGLNGIDRQRCASRMSRPRSPGF